MGIGNSASTTLAVAMANSDTSCTITSDTNFAAKSGEGMILIDESQATEEIIYSDSKSGATLSTPLANRGLEGGSAQAHAINATVKGVLTVDMWNDLIDALTDTLFTQSTGALKSGIVLTTPQINDTSSDHQYIFAASELTADRTVTLPLLTGNDDFVFEDHIQTLTNKRRTRRVVTVTQSATPAINTDNADIASITALAQAITSMTTNLTGTPVAGDLLEIRITDDGTGRAIAWGASFQSTTITLPTTTVASTMLRIGLEWNVVASKWDCIATA